MQQAHADVMHMARAVGDEGKWHRHVPRVGGSRGRGPCPPPLAGQRLYMSCMYLMQIRENKTYHIGEERGLSPYLLSSGDIPQANFWRHILRNEAE